MKQQGRDDKKGESYGTNHMAGNPGSAFGH